MNNEIVLIVDDEPFNISIVAELLSEKYIVKVATSGRAALEMVHKEKPSLILLDVNMPLMSGFEVANELRHNDITADIPFIFLTAKNDTQSIIDGFKHGAVDYISKPFIKEVLLMRVENQINMHKLRNNLALRVEEEILKREEKEKILFQQSKLAQMGNIINMIAHQWRQPLNSISVSVIRLSLENTLDSLTKESIEETSKYIQQQTQNMSKIINDFMEFNKPGSEEEFLINTAVWNAIEMILPQLKSHSITLDIGIDKKLRVFHNIKSIEHVVLNLINNSKDAFEDIEGEDKVIKIFTTKDLEFIKLHIEDNAGGIPKNIIDKIFNSYFTTKKQGKGTGIGLSMSKQLVESVSGCTLECKVVDTHTTFIISWPKF